MTTATGGTTMATGSRATGGTTMATGGTTTSKHIAHAPRVSGSVTAKIEYCVKSILRTCLYIKSILHEIATM
jgi:hypothetical protein